jgi:glycine cleavage system H protein
MFFTDSHEWIQVDGDLGRVGITSHAQKELGDIVYLELPEVGLKVKAGEEVVILESTKAAADIYAPVSGEIVAVNEAIRNSPELLNESPEQAGWLFQIRLSNPRELDGLMSRNAYQQLIDT